MLKNNIIVSDNTNIQLPEVEEQKYRDKIIQDKINQIGQYLRNLEVHDRLKHGNYSTNPYDVEGYFNRR